MIFLAITVNLGQLWGKPLGGGLVHLFKLSIQLMSVLLLLCNFSNPACKKEYAGVCSTFM